MTTLVFNHLLLWSALVLLVDLLVWQLAPVEPAQFRLPLIDWQRSVSADAETPHQSNERTRRDLQSPTCSFRQRHRSNEAWRYTG